MSLVPPKHAPGEEELEELGDEVIISQQSVPHAPPAAAQVHDEKRSVVISDKPPGEGAPPPSKPRKSRGRGDATVVIRDRRKLDEMRREIRESQRAYRRSSRPPRPYLVWGGAALAAFVLGGAVALAVGAATSRGPELAPSAPSVDPMAAERERAKAAPAPPPTVSLEDLPVERRKKR